jgi:hypothetical protein
MLVCAVRGLSHPATSGVISEVQSAGVAQALHHVDR